MGNSLAGALPHVKRFNCAPATLDVGAWTGQIGDMLIFKIFHAHEWAVLQAEGLSLGAPIDLADGFVHFSTAEQVAETAAKHFAGAEGLVLLAVDAAPLGDALKWEVSRGAAKFPHLYAALKLSDVIWDKPMPWVRDHHALPSLER